MDILYLYKKDNWDALKWSLRSLKHIEHGDVWVIGDKCDYDVKNIITEPKQWAYADTNHKFRVGIDMIPNGKEVLLMHDDFFLLEGYEPVCYYSPFISMGGDRRTLHDATVNITGDKRNFALHYPMPFINDIQIEENISMMNLLGPRDGFPKVQAEDCKFKKPTLKNLKGLPCFSTYNETDDLLSVMLKLYPNKSIFE